MLQIAMGDQCGMHKTMSMPHLHQLALWEPIRVLKVRLLVTWAQTLWGCCSWRTWSLVSGGSMAGLLLQRLPVGAHPLALPACMPASASLTSVSWTLPCEGPLHVPGSSRCASRGQTGGCRSGHLWVQEPCCEQDFRRDALISTEPSGRLRRLAELMSRHWKGLGCIQRWARGREMKGGWSWRSPRAAVVQWQRCVPLAFPSPCVHPTQT